jgi:hypothetical protein
VVVGGFLRYVGKGFYGRGVVEGGIVGILLSAMAVLIIVGCV